MTEVNQAVPSPAATQPLMSAEFITEDNLSLFLSALCFSADKHRHQSRKDQDATPFINHPIQVAELLWRVGQVRDMNLLTAALLHDTLEDTDTTASELRTLFGKTVLALVEEVTDDKQLTKEQRKHQQIAHAPHMTLYARQLKLADKTCNVHDIAHAPPHHWSLQRREAYLNWSDQVVVGLRGANVLLESHYDEVMRMARHQLQTQHG